MNSPISAQHICSWALTLCLLCLLPTALADVSGTESKSPRPVLRDTQELSIPTKTKALTPGERGELIKRFQKARSMHKRKSHWDHIKRLYMRANDIQLTQATEIPLSIRQALHLHARRSAHIMRMRTLSIKLKREDLLMRVDALLQKENRRYRQKLLKECGLGSDTAQTRMQHNHIEHVHS